MKKLIFAIAAVGLVAFAVFSQDFIVGTMPKVIYNLQNNDNTVIPITFGTNNTNTATSVSNITMSAIEVRNGKDVAIAVKAHAITNSTTLSFPIVRSLDNVNWSYPATLSFTTGTLGTSTNTIYCGYITNAQIGPYRYFKFYSVTNNSTTNAAVLEKIWVGYFK